MRKLKQLPSHLRGTAQSGGKFAPIYQAVLQLEIGNCIVLEMADTGATDIETLAAHAHTITQTLHVRKAQPNRFSCRRDSTEGLIYIVRKS